MGGTGSASVRERLVGPGKAIEQARPHWQSQCQSRPERNVSFVTRILPAKPRSASDVPRQLTVWGWEDTPERPVGRLSRRTLRRAVLPHAQRLTFTPVSVIGHSAARFSPPRCRTFPIVGDAHSLFRARPSQVHQPSRDFAFMQTENLAWAVHTVQDDRPDLRTVKGGRCSVSSGC